MWLKDEKKLLKHADSEKKAIVKAKIAAKKAEWALKLDELEAALDAEKAAIKVHP